MTPKDYKFASERHLASCLYMLKYIDDYEQELEEDNTENSDEIVNKILLEIYYLSGYVLECIFSYTLFKLTGFDENKIVDDLTPNHIENKYRLDYEHDIKTHSLSQKIYLIKQYGGTSVSKIKLFDKNGKIDPKLDTLYRNWSTNIRYSISPLIRIDESSIRDFVTFCKQIHAGIRQHIIKN